VSMTCDLKVGDSFQWDGKVWKVANVGESMIGLLGTNQGFTEVPSMALEQLVREGWVVFSKTDVSQGLKEARQPRLSAASESDLRVANERSAALESPARGSGSQSVPPRTLRSWTSTIVAF